MSCICSLKLWSWVPNLGKEMVVDIVMVHPTVLGLECANDGRQSKVRKEPHISHSEIQISPKSNSVDPLYADLKVK